MNLKLKRRVATAGAVTVLALGGAGSAFACHNHGTSGVAGASFTLRHSVEMSHGGWHGSMGQTSLWSTVEAYLGISADQLKADLQSGQTLAQIANSTSGKSSTGLIAALVAPFQTALDVKVTAGTLTSSQETDLVNYLNAKFTVLVNGDWPALGWRHGDDD